MAEIGLSTKQELQAYNEISPMLLPGQSRRDLLEFLLESFEPGITPPHADDATLTACLKQLGVWTNDANKPTLDLLAGLQESLQLVWKMC